MLCHTVALCCATPSHYAATHRRIMLCRSLSGVEVTAFCMWLYLQFRDLAGKTPSFACAKLESQVCKSAVLGRCTMKDCRVKPDNDTGHTPGNDSYAMFGGFDYAQQPGLSYAVGERSRSDRADGMSLPSLLMCHSRARLKLSCE